jgi:hypothetical protein
LRATLLTLGLWLDRSIIIGICASSPACRYAGIAARVFVAHPCMEVMAHPPLGSTQTFCIRVAVMLRDVIFRAFFFNVQCSVSMQKAKAYAYAPPPLRA